MLESPSARLRSITAKSIAKQPPKSRSPRPGRLLTIPELAVAITVLRKRTRSGSAGDVQAEDALGRECYSATEETNKESFMQRQRVRGQPDQEQLVEAQWAVVEAFGAAWKLRHQQTFGLERF